jgi:hypothetical protein
MHLGLLQACMQRRSCQLWLALLSARSLVLPLAIQSIKRFTALLRSVAMLVLSYLNTLVSSTRPSIEPIDVIYQQGLTTHYARLKSHLHKTLACTASLSRRILDIRLLAETRNITHALSQCTCSGLIDNSSTNHGWDVAPFTPKTHLYMAASPDCNIELPHRDKCKTSGTHTCEA